MSHSSPERRRRRRKAGYSLGETMLALALISLLSMAIATGVAFGAKQYNEAIRQSEARILCSTLTSVLREEFSNTREIKFDGSELTFAASYTPQQSDGGLSRLVYVDANNKVPEDGAAFGQLALAAKRSGGGTDITTPLIPAASYSSHNNLKARVSVEPEKSGENVGSFEIELTILNSDGSKTLTESTFYVVPLNQVTYPETTPGT